VSINQMVDVLVTTYWNANMDRPEVTRALYRSVVELDNDSLIEEFSRRVDTAAATMFASAYDAVFVDLTLLTSIFGTVRSVFERNLPDPEARAVHRQLVLMCIAYLQAINLPPDRAVSCDPAQ
jgi:hypothetical protein